MPLPGERTQATGAVALILVTYGNALTIRGGYQRERGYTDPDWRAAAVMSLVWAERW